MTADYESAPFPAVLPVIDLLGGQVVHGIAGRRESYRPIESLLVAGSDPRDVARSLRSLVGHAGMYVADLDAIQHDAPDWTTLQQLAEDGDTVLIDAGLREADRARQLVDLGAGWIVAALETLPGPQALAEIEAAVGADRILFSLDLKNGRVVAPEGWNTTDPFQLLREVVFVGVGGVIVLDVAGVGVAEGVPTRHLCAALRDLVPQLPLITGGGVRHLEDIEHLLQEGVDSVLVASALHRGTISPEDLAGLLPPVH